jgi:hypothetical protein
MFVAHSDGSVAGTQELRQYAMRPGGRDALVDLFRGSLVAEQQACAMAIGGVYGDADQPDRFVWFRGFSGNAARTAALEEFYLGPRWARHREAANATMIDSDDVVRLRPVGDHLPVPDQHVALLVVRVNARSSLVQIANQIVAGLGLTARATALAWASDESPNGFPRLPIRSERLAVVGVGTLHGPDRDAALTELRNAVPASSTVLQATRLYRLL